MGEPFDLKTEIQRLSAPDYPPGYTAPNTDDAPDLAIVDSSLGAVTPDDPGDFSTTYPNMGEQRSAMRGSPNDYGWRIQDRQEIGAYRETTISAAPMNGHTLTLDYNLATVFELNLGGSVIFTFPAANDGYDPPDDQAEAPNVTISIVLMLRRQSGSTITWPAGIVWPTNISSAAWTPPTTQRDDTYVLVWSPLLQQWRGHIIAQGYA